MGIIISCFGFIRRSSHEETQLLCSNCSAVLPFPNDVPVVRSLDSTSSSNSSPAKQPPAHVTHPLDLQVSIEPAFSTETVEDVLLPDGDTDNVSPLIEDPFLGQNLFERYELIDRIGKGGYGSVYAGVDRSTGMTVAVKVAEKESVCGTVEQSVYKRMSLALPVGIPRLHYSGTVNGQDVLVMDKLGRNVYEVWQGKKMPPRTASKLAIQMLDALEALHSLGIAHCDLKPENVLEQNGSDDLFSLVDFGAAQNFSQPDALQHYEQEEREDFVGTPWFASCSAHDCMTQSRRDDIESLGYVLLSLMFGRLRWEDIPSSSDEAWDLIGVIKMYIHVEYLCLDAPPQMVQYFKHVRSLRNFEDRPDYDFLRDLMSEMGKAGVDENV